MYTNNSDGDLQYDERSADEVRLRARNVAVTYDGDR